MNSELIKSERIWIIATVVNPVTKLVVENWLREHNISKERVLCLSERGFYVDNCSRVLIKWLSPRFKLGKMNRILMTSRESARIAREIRRYTANEPFVLLKPNIRDAHEHVLHLSRQCLGVYYIEEGSISHQQWQDQLKRWSGWNVMLIWLACLLYMGFNILRLRLSEIFLLEGRRVLGYVAMSHNAFPGRKDIEVVNIEKIMETSFDAVFLGDVYVEVGYINGVDREYWLEAVRSDMRARRIRKLGVRVHSSEKIFTYERYKDFFENIPDWELTVSPYPHPVDMVVTKSHTPLYQIGSSAAIYGKENGFLVISMKFTPICMPQYKRQHLDRGNLTLDQYVDIWI